MIRTTTITIEYTNHAANVYAQKQQERLRRVQRCRAAGSVALRRAGVGLRSCEDYTTLARSCRSQVKRLMKRLNETKLVLRRLFFERILSAHVKEGSPTCGHEGPSHGLDVGGLTRP